MRNPRRPFARAALLAALLATAGAARAQDTEPAPGPAPPDPAAPAVPDPAPDPPDSPGAVPAEGPAPAPPAAAAVAPAVEHGATAGGALAFFMASRDYRTIRDLRSIMTTGLRAAYDKDPTPYNGRKGVRLAAFDYREPAPAPAAKQAAVPVKSLWEDQGEVVEVRTETVRLARPVDGPWRVGAVERTALEPVRFNESIAGVTTLRQILRAWARRDLAGATAHMSGSFLGRQEGREEGIEAVFAGDPALRRAGFRILEMTPRGTTAVTAKVRLVETVPGRPSPLEGVPATLTLVKKGPRWLLDDWR